MKKIIKIIILSVIFIIIHEFRVFGQKSGTATENDGLLKLMTYNLKFASPTFKPTWDERKDMQVNMIKQYNPDIIGTQEGLKEQIDYLAQKLPEYVVVGEGRQGGDDDEHMAIFIKKDKFRLRELQSYQLSETPDVIGSGPTVNPRMVTWVRLAYVNPPETDETKNYHEDYRGHWQNTKEFYVFNTHFFNGNQEMARLSAAKLIKKRMKKLDRFGHWSPVRPIFLMGDFNCKPGSPPYNVLTGGQNAFFDTIKNGDDIDWILYKGDLKVLKYEEVDYNQKGVYPSDHKPIYVEFTFTEK
ncbi:MAG: endonuclease/exonuclease/phosphatase family protein [Reichenbachiella sp.]